MAPKQKKSATTAPAHSLLATQDLPAFLLQQQGQDQLRFLLCGSVDDGKSTLIGRLLWEAQQIPDDQMTSLRQDSKKFGTQGAEPDFALLVDGLAAEREQGITIDVAYRYFATVRRRFIVADTPGHQQYTRNMVTATSTADLAVLLVDARQGLQVQTRRHAYLAALMGVGHLVLAINKMDLVRYDEAVFDCIVNAFNQFAADFGFVSVTAIPLSALKGDNLTRRSTQTPWYAGPTLMALLESVKLTSQQELPLAFPVQRVNCPDAHFRGFSGTIAEGRVRPGDLVRVIASGQTALVSEIVTFDGPLAEAASGDAVTLRLDRDIDVSRGDVLAAAAAPLDMSDQFEATLVWMDQEAGLIGRNYDLKLATQECTAAITNIKYRVDVSTMGRDAAKSLDMNAIAVCNIATGKALAFATYAISKTLGSFLLIDRYSGATVALGMVRHNLRRAQNVHRQALTVTREAREALNSQRGKVVWFTGLSGSGKSTIANALEVALHAKGKRTYLLDGDNVRQGLNKDLGFTDADRVENIRRIAEVAKLMLDAGLIVLASFISPFRREREMAREVIGAENFMEVYVSTSLEVCERRDVKGLYKKARNGELPNMTGINSVYEDPLQPDVRLDGGQGSVDDAVATLMKAISN